MRAKFKALLYSLAATLMIGLPVVLGVMSGAAAQVSSPSPMNPRICTAACSIAGLRVGQSVIFRGGESRTSNTTLTNSTIFRGTGTTASVTYKLDFCFTVSGDPGDFKFNFEDTALGGVQGYYGYAAYFNATSTTAATPANVTLTFNSTADANSGICGEGQIQSADTTITLAWAQNVSSATPTVIASGGRSYMILTRMN